MTEEKYSIQCILYQISMNLQVVLVEKVFVTSLYSLGLWSPYRLLQTLYAFTEDTTSFQRVLHQLVAFKRNDLDE